MARTPSGSGGQTKTPQDLRSSRRCFRTQRHEPLCIRLPGEPETCKQSNRSAPRCQGLSWIGTVTGDEPFLVPSQPGIAIEKRPAVPPETTTWSSSTEGNVG